MKCFVMVEEPRNPKIDDLVSIECHVSGVPPGTDHELVRQAIARRVYNSTPLKLRMGNRIQKHRDDDVPSFFLLRDKLVALLLNASMIVLLGSLVAAFVFPGAPEKALLPAVAHQFAVCMALLSFFLLFISRQFSEDEKDAIGGLGPHPLFVLSKRNLLFFWLSLILLCSSTLLRLMAWTSS